MARQELVELVQGANGFIEKTIDGLGDAQLENVPDGFNNNIVWNLGHLAHSIAGMTYTHAGHDYPLPANYPDDFKGGSSPETWSQPHTAAEVVGNFRSIHKQVCDDLLAGKFDGFEAFELMPGLRMNSAEQVVGFHLLHTGMHMHAIGAIKRALG